MPSKLTQNQFIENSNKKHNHMYDYSQTVYLTSHEKVKIICNTHGSFVQVAGTHLKGNGCVRCAREKKGIANTKTTQMFIEEATKLHGNKYDYDSSIYARNNRKIIIRCLKHSNFSITPSAHLQGQGCPICAQSSRDKHKWSSKEQFIEKVRKIHGTNYDYSKVEYEGTHKKVKIICKLHGIFLQRPNDHITGNGCPNCKHTISKPETSWLNKIGVPNDQEHRQVKIRVNNRYIKVDGFVPETNTIYEFWGDFWHGNPQTYHCDDINPINKESFGELYNRTQQKRNEIITAGYNLIDIWESEYNLV